MRHLKLLLAGMLLLFFLTGCWDERLLRDIRVVYLSGIDLGDEEEFAVSSLLRDLNIGQSSRGERSVTNVMVTANGRNVREASIRLDRYVDGNFDPAKGRTVILGEEFAKKDIYLAFDSVYRDPRININAKIVVTDGTAEELIRHLVENEMEKAEFFYEMVDSGSDNTDVPSISLRGLFSLLMDEGRDFMLPYVTVDQEVNKVKIAGTALFHNKRFTGEFLNPLDSKQLLLFLEHNGNQAILTDEIEAGKTEAITYNVTQLNRDINVVKEDKVHIHISLDLDVQIDDYPPKGIDDPKVRQKLNKQLSEKQTAQAERVFQILAENKSDVLGLGKELKAYYPEI